MEKFGCIRVILRVVKYSHGFDQVVESRYGCGDIGWFCVVAGEVLQIKKFRIFPSFLVEIKF